MSHHRAGYCDSNCLTPQYIEGFIYTVRSGSQVCFSHPIVKDTMTNLHVYGKYDGFCAVPEMYAFNNVTIHSFSAEGYNGEVEGLRYHLGDRGRNHQRAVLGTIQLRQSRILYQGRGFAKPHRSQDLSTQSVPTSQDTYTDQYFVPMVSRLPGYHEDAAHQAVGQL
jgi:hypothetical protein